MSKFIKGFLQDKGFTEIEENVFEHVNGLFVIVDDAENTWRIEDVNDVWVQTGDTKYATEFVKTIEYFEKLNGE